MSLLEGNIMDLVDKILNYHKSKPIRSFREYNESGFHSVIELLLSSKSYVSEMRLIAEYKKDTYKYGFVDLFLLDTISGDSLVLEIKLLNLIGLYRGNESFPITNPDYYALEKLDKLLRTETEESLLNRKYMHWCKDSNRFEIVKVKKYIEDGVAQLNKYLNVVKNGKASINSKCSGILDSRVNIEDGTSYLRGFLIASFGSHKIVTKQSKTKKINFKFDTN